MNYVELQQAILDTTHKPQYAGDPVRLCIEQGETLIGAHLESYNFLAQLDDGDRASVDSPNYNLPERLSLLRYVRIDGMPLDKVDETGVYLYQTAGKPLVYVQRVGQISIAGNPGTGQLIDIDYMGMPEPLSVVDTNTLLDQAPQLYIDAASVYVFRRARDYESASVALDSLRSLCRELNRKTKKLLGGAQSSRAYNTDFRSSY